jgi:peroxiredoxin Q/BCP
MQAFQAGLDRFESLNAQVLGVSPDDMETHKKFSASLGLRFPLIVDQDKAIRKRYAPGRITYLIDRDGIIRFIQEGMPVHEDFLRELEKQKK